MSYTISKIEGIGPKYAARLKKAGINTTARLLERGCDPKGRRSVADESGIDETLILKWTNMADLMRVKGVGEEYSELLEAAGVDTVKELRRRNATNLHQAMVEANGDRRLVRVLPSPNRVYQWVEQAKNLPPILTY
ncbi:MAG: DUF4332 domain-containing protein [Rhodobiaceae bacterium]|nr:DUF4332 domain-containing protein [Rhodobiaceae bacterium]MCC0054703.1 DUF4332 domain-containing protein [Rhodobiaceae bacterium]